MNSIWIAEVEYYQKMSSHAQIRPQGAEQQLSWVNVVLVGRFNDLVNSQKLSTRSDEELKCPVRVFYVKYSIFSGRVQLHLSSSLYSD